MYHDVWCYYQFPRLLYRHMPHRHNHHHLKQWQHALHPVVSNYALICELPYQGALLHMYFQRLALLFWYLIVRK